MIINQHFPPYVIISAYINSCHKMQDSEETEPISILDGHPSMPLAQARQLVSSDGFAESFAHG